MATTVRLPMSLEARAKGYADSIGVPFSALIAVALKDYLDARDRPQVALPEVHGSSGDDALRDALGSPLGLALQGKTRGDRGRRDSKRRK